MVMRTGLAAMVPSLLYGVAVTVFGPWFTVSRFRILPVRRLKVRSPSGKPVQLDGDNLASVPVDITVAPVRLQIVVPA